MPDFNLTKIEEKIQKFWKTNSILEKSLTLRQAQDKKVKEFVFYEGPPTANGLPHIGHFLTRAFKDLFIRYKTMAGFFVPRRAGWDTHGLPVEIEVEKELGLKSKKEIEKYGIAEFNKKAKESVWRYKREWEKFSKRIGFWLDFDNPYITYENNYIESLWQIVKQFDKPKARRASPSDSVALGLGRLGKKFLYQGHKVLPWCPRCGTALSSHEVALGYETITENSVIVKFPVELTNNDISLKVSWADFKNLKTYILSWTTTPWTLPGNVALAVGENIKYQILNIKNKDERYILAKDRTSEVIKEDYEVVKEIKGKDLIGLKYKPLFDIPALKSEKSYKIYPADFVNTEEGTGVVHTAVMYGEDDYQLGEKIGLPKHHTIDKEGKFTKDVPEFAGKFVKDAEKGIIDYLRKKNLLFKVEPYTHEYPHCWRCKTPLLYYATDSWFVKVTAVKKELIANNEKINWIPEYIKDGRFGQWLNEVKDWAFSRDRYWGTPLPIWACPNGNFQFSNSNFQSNPKSKIQNSKQKDGCGNYLVVGSLEELEKFRHKKSNQYFILRHAESTKNQNGDITSSKLEKDVYDLTKKGEGQANKVALELKNNFAIDFIYSSPFLRARRTAEIIAQKTGHKVRVDSRLKEVDYGSEHEGLDPESFLPELLYPEYFSQKLGIDGESRDEVKKRVFDFIKEMEEKHEGKNILIVSHGDPLWLFEGIAKGIIDKDLFQIKSRKREVKEVNLRPLKTGEFRFFKFNNYPRNEFGSLDLHRPFVDEVILKCPDCGGKMKRTPEVIDVWFDSGAMPYASQNQKSKIKNKNLDIRGIYFPADFITEGVDQTRGWFYTLLAVSTLLGFGPPYKNVISLGHVLDKEGKKMSKSLGNVITPDYVIEKFGADAARWWFYKVNQAGEVKSFREKELEEINNGLVRVLVNSLRFWQLYNKNQKSPKESLRDPTGQAKIKIQNDSSKIKNFHQVKPGELNLLDRWLLSKWNSLIISVTESLDGYDATKASREIEKFVIEDLSNWWIRRSRSRFQDLYPIHDRAVDTNQAENLLKFILLELTKLIAPFTPFLAEYLHEELHAGTKKGTMSVHFQDWPKADKKLVDEKLEEEMQRARDIITEDLGTRKEKDLKVRQPLSELIIRTDRQFNSELEDLIKDELNVKKITYQKPSIVFDMTDKNLAVSAIGNTAIVIEITPALRAEGWVREFIRAIQDARKDAGYKYNDKVEVFWFAGDKSLSEAVKREEKFIKQKTVLKELKESSRDPKFAYDIEKEQDLEPGRKIWLGLKK